MDHGARDGQDFRPGGRGTVHFALKEEGSSWGSGAAQRGLGCEELAGRGAVEAGWAVAIGVGIPNLQRRAFQREHMQWGGRDGAHPGQQLLGLGRADAESVHLGKKRERRKVGSLPSSLPLGGTFG